MRIAAEQNPQHENATKEDIVRLARSIIKLRDERIAQAEAQLTRLADDYRKLRQELLPVFKQAKERSEPLPYAPYGIQPVISPEIHAPEVTSAPVPLQQEKSSLSRTFSKRLGLGSTPKSHSPTHLPSTIQEGKENSGSLDPSAAATAASNQLTASMSGGTLPQHSPSIPSPTSPLPYQHQPLAPRSYQREATSANPHFESTNGHTLTPPITRDHDPPTSAKSASSAGKPNSNLSQQNNLPPSRDQTSSAPPPQTGSASSGHTAPQPSDAPSVEIFKSFKVGLEDPCYKVLPAALHKYNIQADWRQYALYIVYGDQERCVGLEEKPLALFKVLDREGKKPMFMLRKLANPGGGGGGGGGGGEPPAPKPMSAGGGVAGLSSAASVRTLGVRGELPGGVL